ncbi:MAG TPA: MmgE/PrpD family protein [Gaiellaceae bacterium]
MTLARRQAAFAADLRFDDLPDAVVASVKARVLDTLGIAFAASSLDTSDAVRGVAAAWGGSPDAAAIGAPRRLPAHAAALVNGTLAHSLDFDDTHLPSILHPSACIVPAALAAGQAARSPGREVVTAAAAAYELCVRLGMAAYDPRARNNVFFEKGLHATSICGTIAAAVAAARLAGLGADGIEAAIGIAASMGAGLLEANRAGGTVKRVHCGWAAHAGIAAAALATAGVTGPATVLEGRFGFFNALCDGEADLEVTVDGLGERWETPGIHFKPYPANHFTHAGIDAALALREAGLAAADVREIELGVAAPTLRTIAEPAALKARPPSGYAAQFSGPFTVATALTGGGGLGVYLDDFTDARAADEELLALAARVRCVPDPPSDELFPGALPGVLRVTLRSGESREHRVTENRGGPGRPLSPGELGLKFELNASRALPDEAVARLRDRCFDLDSLASLDDLTSCWEDS